MKRTVFHALPALSAALVLGALASPIPAAAAPPPEAPAKALVFVDEASRAALTADAIARFGRAAVRELPGAIEVDAAGAAQLAEHALRVVELPDPFLVKLRGGVVDLRRHVVDPAALPGSQVPLIVAFQGVLDARRIGALEAAGAALVGHLPPSAYLVRADVASAGEIARLDGVVAVASFDSDWKISHRIPPGPISADVEIVVFPGADVDPVIEGASDLGSGVSSFPVANRAIVKATLDSEGMDQIAALPEVEMIEAAGVGELFNNEIRVLMQTEKAHYQATQAFYNPIYGLGVWGKSQTVTIADSGILASHEIFADPSKLVANYAVPGTCATTGDAFDHGTGVASTLLGDKIGGSGLYGTANDLDGLSLRSPLIVQDIEDGMMTFCPPNDYPLDLFYPAWNVGSMVHSNSWGHWAVQPNPQGAYSWRSQAIDWYLHEPLVREQSVIFAAGNAGATWNSQALYTPYSLSDEAHSKNAVVVGGTLNGSARDVMYRWSSRGPTDDCLGTPCRGIPRVKPDLLAPASSVVDTATAAGASAYTGNYSGTSYSAPAVAGAAALVRDYFIQGIYPVNASDPPLGGNPGSALVKAMLVNATVPIYDSTGYEGNALVSTVPAAAYPNYDQGYGRPALDNVLDPAGYRKLKAFEDDTTSLVTGDAWSRIVYFKQRWDASCNNLRVTLVWNDKEGSLAAGPKLVNDLDLQVDFQGRTWRGNHFLTGGAVFDGVNNVEDVFVPLRQQTLGIQHQPVVTVYGTSVPAGPQPFAVVATYGACADEIPCPPSPIVGGCYRGPGDTVPGATWTPPVPGCREQTYSSDELDGSGSPYPFCTPGAPIGNVSPVPVEPVEPTEP